MPRHTLDSWVRKLKTMDVMLTKHKEDDVYNHMVKMHEKAEELFEKYDAKYRTIMKEFEEEENHMYAKYDWRQGDPSRFWLKNADRWYSVDCMEDEKEIVEKEYFYLVHEIWADFMICDKYSEEWREDKPDWSDMVTNVDRIHNILKNIPDTIKCYEAMDFMKYKSRWQTADKDWIEEEKYKKEHLKKHPKIQLPKTTVYDEIPEPYPEAPLRDDCIFCKKHWEEMKSKYDKAIEIWSQNKQEWDEYNKKQQLEDEKKRIKKERVIKDFIACFDLKEDLHCHVCDFTAKDSYELHDHKSSVSHKKNCRYCKVCNHQSRTDEEFDEHLETLKHKNKEEGIEEVEKTKEDIKKSRYCEICQLQCRTDNDYNYHLETTKHKKNAGLIEKVKIYKCNHCDYQTTIKCNFEKHIVSKNHM